MKVITVVGTRPEVIRLSRTIALLDKTVDHVLVHTGQNATASLKDVFFAELGIREPDYTLNSNLLSTANFLSGALIGVEHVLDTEEPDAFLVLGDTNSSLTAILAKMRHIPIYHLEAGNRSFDANVPEEINRRVVDHLADFNFPYSEHARRNLTSEGLPSRRIVLSGSPLPEVVDYYREEFEASDVLGRLSLRSQEFILLSAHRQENVDSPERLNALLLLLTNVGKEFGLPIVVSTHPRTGDKLRNIGNASDIPGVSFHEPFGFFDYMKLQSNAFCVLSDSGTVSEEASIIGFPAVTLRSAIERPEAVETGVLTLSDLDTDRTIMCINYARHNRSRRDIPQEYLIKNFSHRVVSTILSTANSHKFWSGLR